LDSRIPWPEGLEQPDAYCERRFGVALRQFVAVASAAALSRIDIDVSDPGSVPFNPNTYFEDTRIEPGTAIRILNELRYESPAQDPSAAVHDPANFWSFFDLADRPLVPCGTNIVAPCSIRYSLERGSTGVFWMLHASHRGDVRAFTTHFGHLFEDYCLRVAEGLHSVTTVVSGEIEYGPPSSRQRSADILISTLGTHGQPARVFIECRAGRPPSAVFTHSSRDAFANYVEDLVGKLLQLDRVVGDHQAGAFAIPGDLAGADDAYLPMLVVDVPFHWTFSLRTLLDDAIRSLGIFRRPHVAQPIVCSIEELESLVHACETGADLAELLRSHLFNDRMDPLQLLILEKTGPLQPPSFTEGGWSEWRELVNHELFG
jgi:hypothetical protein